MLERSWRCSVVLKYIGIALLIPILVTFTASLIAASTQSSTPVHSVSITYTYRLSTIDPLGRPVFIFVSDDISLNLRSYNTTGVYAYEFYIMVKPLSLLVYLDMNKVEDFRVYIFTTTANLGGQDRSLPWNTTRPLLDLIKYNKIAVLRAYRTSYNIYRIPITRSLVSKSVHIAVVVVLNKYARLNNIFKPSYAYQMQSPALVSAVVENDLRGVMNAASTMYTLRRTIAMDTYGMLYMEILLKISLTPQALARTALALAVTATIFYVDYRFFPEEYETWKKYLGQLLGVLKTVKRRH
jgi:hypothetical protein